MSNGASKEQAIGSEQQQLPYVEPNSRFSSESRQESNVSSNNPERCADRATEVTVFLPDDDEPPPYESVVDSDHVSWSRMFASKTRGLYYTANSEDSFFPSASCQTCSAEYPVVSIPLTPYAIFRVTSSGSVLTSSSQYWENLTSAKVTAKVARSYGVILIAAVVIISLMALSLLVRCIVKKSFG